MNCIDLLRINGPMEAADIARYLDLEPKPLAVEG